MALAPLRPLLLTLLIHSTPAQSPAQDVRTAPLDLILAGGRVYDGTGNPWFGADLGIRDGRIVALGDLSEAEARERIDCQGLCVAPGFIDIHSHADRGLTDRDPDRRAAPNLVAQGITTVVVGQDGRGAPIAAQRERMQELGIGPNTILLLGHGTLRNRVLGRAHRRPSTDEEVDAIRALVREGMEAGAWGMSAGLEYVPGRWATHEEMLAVVGELAPFDGVYVLHERSSGIDPMWYVPSRDEPGPPSMLDNIVEIIDVAERTGVTSVATHIKVRGAKFWGSGAALVRMIREARDRGVPIYADQYPYNTSGTDGRVVLIPGWVFAAEGEGSAAEKLEAALADPEQRAALLRDLRHEMTRRGDAENLLILDYPDQTVVGMNLREFAASRQLSTVDAALALQVEGYRDRRGGARMRGFSMHEDDVELLGAQEWTATCTDAGIALPEDGPVHPRFSGTFPRKIRHYAIDRSTMSVADAIRSATSLPAQILGIRDRGVVRVGCHADLVVFDLETIRDRATPFEPHARSEGVVQVLIGGEFVLRDGELTNALPGEVLDRPE